MKFEATWLPGGSVQLADLPLQGQREILESSQQDAELVSAMGDQRFLAFAQIAMAANHVLPSLGPEKTKKMFDDSMLGLGDDVSAYVWPVESFADCLKAEKEGFIFKRLQPPSDNDADAILKIDALSQKVKDRATWVGSKLVERLGERDLVILYWRLRASGVKSISLPTGEATLDWSLEPAAKKATFAILSEVATSADFKLLRSDGRPQASREDFAPQSAADVEGKS
jgi:hypothetical protein